MLLSKSRRKIFKLVPKALMQPSNCWLIEDHDRPSVGSFLFQAVVSLQSFPNDNHALPYGLNLFNARARSLSAISRIAFTVCASSFMKKS